MSMMKKCMMTIVLCYTVFAQAANLDFLCQAPGCIQIQHVQPIQEYLPYLQKFPYHLYTVCHIPNLGAFYTDKDGRYDTIKNVLRRGEAWETFAIEIIKKYVIQGTVALDIGAHIGTHTITMSRCVGWLGTVIAFEPQIKIYSELVENLRMNNIFNVRPLRCALGEANRQVEMDPTRLYNEGGTAVGSGGDKVEMRTLDSFNLKNVSFIKMDAENYEDRVLEGAMKTIQENRPIMLIEIMGNTDKARETGDNLEKRKEAAIERLESLNYKVIPAGDYLAIPMEKLS